MAEWVQKGNLKGPQGERGQDAQLPAGGTAGQVLTKTADGEAWQDAPEPDMTGVATFKSIMGVDFLAKVGEGGQEEFVHQFCVVSSDYDPSSEAPPTKYVAIVAKNSSSILGIYGEKPVFEFGTKKIRAITDDIADGSDTSLATAKAVKYYADSVGVPSGGTIGQVLTKTENGLKWQDAQTIDTPVPISQGGTGATTAEGARTALGIPDIEVATDEEFDSYMGLS